MPPRMFFWTQARRYGRTRERVARRCAPHGAIVSLGMDDLLESLRHIIRHSQERRVPNPAPSGPRLPVWEDVTYDAAPPEVQMDMIRDLVERGSALPVGTIRHRKDGDYKKIAAGQWRRLPKGAAEVLPQVSAGLASAAHIAVVPPSEVARIVRDPAAILIPPRGPWVQKLKGMPDDTLKAHTKDGKVTPERKVLHEQIAQKFLASVQPVPEDKSPVSVLMMGGPASGKSSMVRAQGFDASQFVNADADGVKESIPEYREAIMNRAKNAAAMAHEESSMLVKSIRQEAIDTNRNLIVDGTGAKLKSYEEAIGKLKGKGYNTHLMLADCDADIALKRAKDRAKKTGRYVPDHFVTEAYSAIPGNFLKAAQMVDSFQVYDSRGNPPKMVWSKENGVETIHDPEWHKDFLKRAGVAESRLTLLRSALTGIINMDENKKPTAPVPVPKPPAVDMNAMASQMIQAFVKDEAEVASLPDVFDETDGVVQVENEEPDL